MHVHKTVLENGIRVLSDRMEGVRSVSVGALVEAGPVDERPSERGYAHLLEHMLFQGTEQRDAGAIAEMMEIGGGAMGAFTAREYTVYHSTVLDDYVTFALEVLGDMLGNSVLPDGELDQQRRVILNELIGDTDPLERANDLLKATMWPDHPLGYPTAGSDHAISAVSRESLLAFMRRNYSAPKLVLVAAGNVDHEQFVAQVRDSFWSMNGKQSRPTPISAPRFNRGAVIADARDYQQVYFTLAWPAPTYTDPARYAWHVFVNLLGGGPTSRLYRRLREEMGLVYHIAAQYHAYRSAGALVIEGATPAHSLVPVLANVLIELFKMADSELHPDYHQRAVQSLISQHLISSDSAYVRMSRLALQEMYFKTMLSSDAIIEGLRSQSIEAIQTVAQTVCLGGLPTIALVGPVSESLLGQVSDMLGDFGDPPTVAFAPRFEASAVAS